MKKLLFFLVAVTLSLFVSAQTIVFHENFELPSGGDSLISTADEAGFPTTNFIPWSLSSYLAKSGVRSDSNRVQNGKTIYLTSNSFSTTGNTYVILEFSQICKMYFADGGQIEVSADGGTTWTILGAAQYMGTGVMALNKFSENSYNTDWSPGDTLIKPTNSWWKNEKFDISSIAANQGDVKIRFKYNGSGNPLGAGRYGWLLDDIKVTASPSELVPPVITMTTYPIDTIYSAGPYSISAYVTDNTGIDTVFAMYKVGNGSFIHLGLTKSPTIDSLYTGAIPFPGWGKKVTYYLTAIDASAALNTTIKPLSGYYSFFTKYFSGGNVTIGTGTTQNMALPIEPFYGYSYSQSLYNASLIQSGGLITKVSYFAVSTSGYGPDNFRLYMGNSTKTTFASTTDWEPISNLTLVYDGTLTVPAGGGWIELTLSTPFNYNGVGSLVIGAYEFTAGYHSSTDDFNCTQYTGNVSLYFYDDVTNPDPASPPTGITSTYIPNTKLLISALSGLTQDAGIPQITNPTGGVTAGQAFNVEAKIKNYGSAILTKAAIKYSIDGGVPASYLWTGSLNQDSVSIPVVIGSLNLAVGPHALKVWSELPNDSLDQNNINDTAYINFYACANQLNGPYTIGGTGANFATFAEALVGLTQCGINGAVTFNVAAGNYPEQLTIPEISGASATNTITFKAATNDSTSVVLNYTSTAAANWIVKLNGADYVTFKNIKFAPADSANSKAIILTNGATNNNFIGNYIVGYYGTGDNLRLITIEATGVNAYNTFYGNRIFKGSRAIDIKGTSALPLDYVVIKNNVILEPQVYGIFAQYINNVTIDSNTVTASYTNANKYGIYIQYANHFDIITKNTINLTGGTNMYGILAENSIAADSSKGLIANNMISVLNGATFAYGIRLNTCTKYKVYSNSVVSNGNSATDTRSINTVSSSTGIELMNNNLQSNKYPIYVEGTSVSVSNYNNYYSTGTSFSYWGTTAYANLAALTAVTLKDSNSVNINPLFNSLSDLHTFNGLLYGMGISLPEITTDIDGAPRLSPPCIGADEFLPPQNDAALTTILTPNGACGLTAVEQVKVVIKNVGVLPMTANSYTATYKIVGGNPITPETINRAILPGDTIQYTFTIAANLSVAATHIDSTYKFRAWVDLTGDYAHANDTSDKSVLSSYLPPAPIAQDITIPYGNSVTISAVSSDSLYWFTVPSGGTSVHTGHNFTTPVLFDTTTYYVEARAGSPMIKFTEITQYRIGTGTTISYPSWCVGQDLIEITNLGSAPADLSGWGCEILGTGARTFTLPSNVLLTAGQVLVLHAGTGTDDPTNRYYNMGGANDALFSTGLSGFILRDLTNQIVDVVATNGFTFTSGGVTATDWSGSIASSSAGVTRTISDNNLASDWIVATASIPQTMGSLNPTLIAGGGSGCSSSRVPLTVNVAVFSKETGISSISTPSGCGLNLVPVTIDIFNNGSDTISNNITATYKIDNGNFITPENMNVVIPPFDTIQFTFNTLANFFAPNVDTFFKITAIVNLLNDPFHQNDTLVKDSILSRYTPLGPLSSNVYIPYGNQATLTATSPNPLYWYNDLFSTTSIAQGTPYITPYLYVTDTFYVAANTSQLANVTIGNGTLAQAWPFYTFYMDSRTEMLYKAPELLAQGMVAGSITSLAFNVATVGSPVMNGFKIQMQNYTPNTLSAFNSTGWTTVFSGTYAPPATGWQDITLQTPFNWDGVSNVLISICFDNTSYTTNSTVYTSNVAGCVYHSHSDLSAGSGCTDIVSGSVYADRPNIKFIANIPGCGSQKTPVIVNVGPPPQNDAGVLALTNPVGSTPSGVSTPIKVKIKNYGLAPLTSAKVAWRLNGAVKPIYNFTGNIAPGLDSVVTIANETFSGGAYCVKAWTYLPNNVLDSVASNDTLFNTCFTACLNGNYTIGDTTGGNYHDFPTFNAAINTLKIGGVCGNVTFLVDTGTYNEQVRIPEIMGASASSTITFRSASNDSTKVKLQYNASLSTANYTLLLDSADYIRFEKMTIKALSTTYGYVIELRNGATNNIISNNIIENPVTTSYSSAGIYNYTTANNYNKILYNKILNGYYGIYSYGSAAVTKKGIEIIGNDIQNFYYYGIYCYYNDSSSVIRNTVTSSTSTSTYNYGIWMYYCNNKIKVTYNKVALTTTGAYKYGILLQNCIATDSTKGIVANNFSSVLNGGTYAYGIRLYTCTNFDVVFNSAITNGTSTTDTRALNITSACTLIKLFNNNLQSNRYPFHIESNSSITASNNNNIYATGTVFAVWNGTPYANLAALKAASLKDSNSVSINPLFISNTDLHILTTLLAQKGRPIAGIVDDIDGTLRNTTAPAIGAHEVQLIANDAGVTYIAQPGAVETEGSTLPVKVAIMNFGTSPITSMQVSYKIGNGTPVVYQYTGNLASLATDTVYFPYMVVPAGNQTICAYTTLTGDINSFNDQTCKNFFGTPLYDAQMIRILPLAEGCGLTTDTVIVLVKNKGINAINNGFFVNFQRIGEPNITTEYVTATINPNDSLYYTFNTPLDLSVTTLDSNYHIQAWVVLSQDNIPGNDIAFRDAKSLHTPPDPLVNNISIPFGTSANLVATSVTNDPLYWFDVPAAGTSIFNGGNYISPYLYATDTFYVEAKTGFSANITITGGVTQTTQGWPFYTFYMDSRTEMLYKATELLAQNLVAGSITSIAFDINSVGSPVMNGFNIKMQNYTPNTLSGFNSTGWTTVYSGSYAPAATGWQAIQLQTPFNWDGVSNVLVSVCFDNSSYTTNSLVNSSNVPGCVYHSHSDLSAGNGCTDIVSGAVYADRPNIKLIANVAGCASQRIPAIVNVGPQSPKDAGVIEIVTPSTAVNLTNHETVMVKIKNFGSTPIYGLTMKYKVDNNIVISQILTDTIPANDTIEKSFTVLADLSSSAQPQTFVLKAWTSLTNDATALNDTCKKTVINKLPVYCPSSATYTSDMDLVNVTLGNINNTSVPIGSMYTDFTTVAPTNLQPGMTYTISVSSNFVPPSTYSYAAWLNVFIDFNRDGVFDTTIASGERAYAGSSSSFNTVTGNITVPFMASPGLTRMRVVLNENGNVNSTGPCGFYLWGETEDYTVNIIPPIPHDAGIAHMNSMGTYLPYYTTNSQQPQFFIRNYGSDLLTNATVKVNINGTINSHNYAPTNPLISLGMDSLTDNMTIQSGLNHITAYTELAGDTNYMNDTIHRKVFKEFATTPPYFDNFETNEYFYAIDTMEYGYPINNLWKQGIPNPNIVPPAPSASKVWATNLDTNYTANNTSYLYSPVFLINPMQADSLKFWQWRQMGTGATAQLQYKSTSGSWVPLGSFNDVNATNWYNDSLGGIWKNNTNGWVNSTYKLSNLTNLGSTVQFRFVFKTINATPLQYGWAIDNFEMTLLPLPNDAGVINIVTPTATSSVGDSVLVKVTVKNFGTDPLTNIPVKYKASTGSAVVSGILPGPLASGASVDYQFTQKYAVGTSSYSICAYTNVTGDIYIQNDTSCKSVNVIPALIDVGITEIIDPIAVVVSGQVIYPKVVIKNFGSNPQTSIPLSYQRGTATPVTGTWTRVTPLNLGDTAHFTFATPFNVPIGTSFAFSSFTTLANDAYSPNNKTSKSVLICNVTAPTSIVGTANPDFGQTGVQYTADSVPNATSYNWTYTGTNYTINGNGTRFITIDFASNATTGQLSVTASSAICTSDPTNFSITVGVNEIDGSNFWLGQNMPNPTTGLTNIAYSLPSAGEIRFNIVNLYGQSVYTFRNVMESGRHLIDLNVNDLSAGVYYYTIEFKGKRLVKKMVVNK
jgi:hypothetical protein